MNNIKILKTISLASFIALSGCSTPNNVTNENFDITGVVCPLPYDDYEVRGIDLYIQQNKVNDDGSINVTRNRNYHSIEYFNDKELGDKNNPLINEDKTDNISYISQVYLESKNGDKKFIANPEDVKEGISYSAWLNSDKNTISFSVFYSEISDPKVMKINGYPLELRGTRSLKFKDKAKLGEIYRHVAPTYPDKPSLNIRAALANNNSVIRLVACPIYLPQNTIIDPKG